MILISLKNGRLLSVNFERDVHLQDMTVPLELIHKVLLMRCPSGDMPDCTMPGGMITDFNIWDRSFSSEDMKSGPHAGTLFFNKS